MAIVFTTGTINAANAGAVGLAMAEKIRDDVVAHVAWDLVEEYTAPSGLVTWYVFKCLAAQSGLPNDFYVVMGRTIGSGELRMFICEGYTAATHTAAFYGTMHSNTVIAYDASGRSTSTYVLGTAVLATTPNTNPQYSYWVPSGVATKWWLSVDSDGFTAAFNGASNGFVHCGAYTPLTALGVTMPLHMTSGSNSVIGSDIGSLTRNPAVGGGNAKGYALASLHSTILGFAGRLDYSDKLQADQRPVGEVGVTVYENTPGDRAVQGCVLGKMKRVRTGASGSSPAGIAFGDAYALQSRLWVPYLPTDYRMWDTGTSI